MSSAQEKVLIAVTVAILVDGYSRLVNNVLPSVVLWLMGFMNH